METKNIASTKKQIYDRLAQLLKSINGSIVTHFYANPDIQEFTDYVGGYVGDSLGMAAFGTEISANLLIVAGVRFMGETAKILSPKKTILMPTLAADCSLDFSCPEEEFRQFCKNNPLRTVVVYANTSAQVKALSDWVVTSSNAIEIVRHLHEKGERILWASDRYLGEYVQRKTNADMLIWPGSCIVHDKFNAEGIIQLKKLYPEAAILVHPESPRAVVDLGDVVGSTSKLIEASAKLPNMTMIVATERGILHKMRQLSPDKNFIIALSDGEKITSKNSASCPWMAMNSIEGIEMSLVKQKEKITLSEELISKASAPLERMLDFCRQYRF